MTRGSATIVVCGTDTASTLPVRSKMLPRSAGMATVRTRCPRPSETRWERSRAWRAKRRTPTAGKASTCTRRMTMSRTGIGGSGRAGARFGPGVVRGRAGCVRCAGRAWRCGTARVRGTGVRAEPRVAGVRRPLRSRLLGAKARLRLRPIRDGVGGGAVVVLRHRRVGHVQVLRRVVGDDQPEALRLLDDARRRSEQGRGQPPLLVPPLLLVDLRVQPVELELVLREDDV